MIDTRPVLITGATGNVGRLLVGELGARGVPFRAMVRPGSQAESLGDVETVEGDFDDVDSLERALTGIGRAFLLTPSSERAEAQQKRFVEAARRAGVGHIVKLSQLKADVHSPVRFLRYHAAVEQALRDSGLAWTFVRPNLFLQAYLAFADEIRKGTLPAPIGEAKISVVDTRDIAAVAAAALTEPGHEGKTYTVTGPKGVSHAEIAAAFSRVAGYDIEFQSVPPEAFATALKGAGMPEWQVDGLIEDYAHYDRGEATFAYYDLERVTGRPPRSVDEFARDYGAAFRREFTGP